MGNKASSTQFTKQEIDVLETTFKEMVNRSNPACRKKKCIDREMFIRFFGNLPVLLAERLFFVFDVKQNAFLSSDEFIGGLSLYARGDYEEKVRVFFKIFDLDGDGGVSRLEMETILMNISDWQASHSQNVRWSNNNDRHLRHSGSLRSLQRERSFSDVANNKARARVLSFGLDPSGSPSARQSVADSLFSGVAVSNNTSGSVSEDHSAVTKENGKEGQEQDQDKGVPKGKEEKEDDVTTDLKEPASFPSDTGVVRPRPLSLSSRQSSVNTVDRIDYISVADLIADAFADTAEAGSSDASAKEGKEGSVTNELLNLYAFTAWVHRHPELLHVFDSAFCASADKDKEQVNLMDLGGMGSSFSPLKALTDSKKNKMKDILSSKQKKDSDKKKRGSNTSSSGDLSLTTILTPVQNKEFFGFTSDKDDKDRASVSKVNLKDRQEKQWKCSECQYELVFAFCVKCGRATSSSGVCECSSAMYGGSLDNVTYCPKCGSMFPKFEPKLHDNLISDSYQGYEGTLSKVGARFKSLHSRWYVLKDHYLYSFKKQGENKPDKVLALQGCYVEPANHERTSPKLKYGLEIIISDDHSLFLYCENEDERQHWLSAMRQHAGVLDIHDYYELGKELGVGRFSVVRHGRNKATNANFAIKVLDKTEMDVKEREAVNQEISILKLVSHPNLIRLKNVFEDRRTLYLVLSYVSGGELADRIHARKRYSESMARSLIKTLLGAVQYLHQRGIVHCDLKPENILLKGDKDDNIAIADFGLAKFAGINSNLTQEVAGTLAYLAPEILQKAPYSTAVDMWSSGVIMYQVLSGKLPFDSDTEDRDEIIAKTLEGNISFDDPAFECVSSECKDLITQMLKTDPKLRISVTKAQEHPWFRMSLPTPKQQD